MSDAQLNTIPDEIQERWLPVPDFPGYEVSDVGRVRSFWKRVGLGKGCGRGTRCILAAHHQVILKPKYHPYGYPMVTFRKSGKRFNPTIHSLVLLAFIGPCPPGCESCHNNGNPLDNRPSNLRWDTKSANSQDSIRHGTHSGHTHQGMNSPQAKLTDDQVLKIRELYAHGYLQKTIGQMFGVNQQHVSDIVNRNKWKHLP